MLKHSFFVTILSILAACLFSLAPQPLSAQVKPSSSAAPLIDAEGFPELDADWRARLAAVVAAEQEYLPGAAPYTLTAFDTYQDASGEWALAVIVPAAVVEAGWENVDLDQLVDVLLRRTPAGRSEGHVRSNPAFLAMAQVAPLALVDYSPLFAVGPSMQHEAEGYRFPWTAGQTWWGGGRWHSGYGANALDFGPLTGDDPAANSAVLAAAGGTLRMACQNDGEQRLLWIEHPNGERTGYLHLDRAAVAAAVEETQLVGQQVEQGALLGMVYRGEAKIDGNCPANFPGCTFNTICGYGNAPHVHFVLPNRDLTIDGIPVAVIGSGAAGDRFTSSNPRKDAAPVAPDSEPPTALLAQPISGSVFFTPTQDATLAVELVATDTGGAAAGGSGVAGVQVRLAWQQDGGAWQATDWTAATAGAGGKYTAAFAACTPAWRVPHNRPLRVSLQATDKAGNQTFSDEAGVFRYSFPDLNRDCIVEIKDVLDLLPALLDSSKARPEHDVDASGSLDAADALALLAAVFGDSYPTAAHEGVRTGQLETAVAPVFPGLGSRVQFTPLPPLPEIASARDVAVAGTTALVADWQAANLALVDLSQPLAPAVAGLLPLSDRAYGIAAAGSLAYASDPQDAGQGRLALFDLAQPLAPTLVAALTLPGEVMESAIVSDSLYMAAGYAGLHVVDVSAPQTPTLLFTLDTPGIAADVAVADDIVYVADQENGLLIYRTGSISPTAPFTPTEPLTPTAPITPVLPLTLTALAAWDTPGTAIGVSAVLSTVYIADGFGGVQVVDVADPATPRLLSTYTTTAAINSVANSVIISGTTLYVAAGWQGVLALDIADPTAPYLAGSHATPGYAHDLALAGDLLLVATGPGGLQPLRVDRQAAPEHYLLIPLAMKK